MQQPNQAAPIGAYVPAQGESPIMIQTNQAAPPGASVPAEGAPTITLFEKLKNDSPIITLMVNRPVLLLLTNGLSKKEHLLETSTNLLRIL